MARSDGSAGASPNAVRTMANNRSNTCLATLLGGFLGTLVAAGCGSTAGTQQSGATAAPAPVAMSSSAAYRHHGRHRHGHHRYGSAAGAAGVGAGAAAAGVAGGAVANGGAVSGAQVPHAGASGAWPCNDTQFLQDQQRFASGSLQGDQEVDVCGSVTQVLPERDTRSGLHGYYDVLLPSGATIEIVSDLGEMNAPAWPWVKVGDYSYVQGRYYYDSSGSQGIDWTHHGTSRSWPSAGYVVVNGVQYQ